jgi:predicted NBD/HSP70 family sugar kinase
MNTKWGIDLGGTKIEGVVLPESSTKPLARLRLPTEASKGYEHILSQVDKVIQGLEEATGLKRYQVGVGTPGAIDPDTGLLKNSNTLCLNAETLDSDLNHFLKCEVKMANDANCFALAETLLGAVPSAIANPRVVFGVIMGTGVGSGIVFDGKVWEGRHGIAGEWGHNVLDQGGNPCYCGKNGCVEQVISGPSLERFYTDISGRILPLKIIAERWREGEPEALEVKERLLSKFAESISYVINILDPDAVVLGGGVGNIEELYTEAPQRIMPYLFNSRLSTTILRPTLGDSAGVYGAAMLF